MITVGTIGRVTISIAALNAVFATTVLILAAWYAAYQKLTDEPMNPPAGDGNPGPARLPEGDTQLLWPEKETAGPGNPTSTQSGGDVMGGYQYRGNRGAMPDAEVQARITAARAQAGSNAGGPVSPRAEVPKLKGAVKVGCFPERSKYPFRQIADDGGIWQIDPAAFKVTPGAIVQAARKWAETHHLAVKVTTDDGFAYVQFRKDGA